MEKPTMPTDDTAKALTAERKKTHGDWHEQSQLCDDFISLAERSRNWNLMPAHKRMAMFNILQKCSRLLSGNFSHDDAWNDIEGYAFLGKDGHHHE